MNKSRTYFKGNFFTLVELLIVVAIIMLLAGMLLPALRSARERARQIQCASNMKQSGYAMASYSIDFNNYVVLSLYSGSTWGVGYSARWLELLNGTWGVEYLKNKDVVLCPSFVPFKYETVSFTYGARTGFPANSAEVVPSGYLAGPIVNLAKLTSPATYLMLADSYSTTYQKQIYVLQASGVAYGIHLRHTSRQGNILSGDFHVESADRAKVKNWEITGGYIGTDLITF